jgi:uncharacterized protein (DUF2235 family)
MPKNIVIFSDGTGQVGGINFDEDRTNIYKMYRACRVGPDSNIKPSEQVAFYDPGLGSVADGGYMLGRAGRWVYNKISQATGLGITANIIDGYAALIRLWRPGDRIFLFGFSRGAYTVRCLASVIGTCGIPQAEGGEKIRLNFTNSRRIARRAVKRVYQYTHSVRRDQAKPRERELMDQRTELGRQFRDHFKSSDPMDPSKANVYPHFIGVFDTVSAVATPGSLIMLLLLYLGLVGIAAAAIKAIPSSGSVPVLGSFANQHPVIVVALLGVLGALVIGSIYFIKLIVWARGLREHSWWRTVHLVQPKQQFRDFDLNEYAGYARHAISIDENRSNFARVPWGFNDKKDKKHEGVDEAGNPWFQQLWFAGNHADIGGGYPENESRLSDCALGWMVAEARKAGLKVDDCVLRIHAACDGIQHDEVATGFGLFTRLTGRSWKRGLRSLPDVKTTVHESVYERFECGDVLQYDVWVPYRPSGLETHEDFGWRYLTVPSRERVQAPTVNKDATVPRPTKEQPG